MTSYNKSKIDDKFWESFDDILGNHIFGELLDIERDEIKKEMIELLGRYGLD